MCRRSGLTGQLNLAIVGIFSEHVRLRGRNVNNTAGDAMSRDRFDHETNTAKLDRISGLWRSLE